MKRFWAKREHRHSDTAAFDWLEDTKRAYVNALIEMLPTRNPIMRLAQCPLSEQHTAVTELRDDIAADAKGSGDDSMLDAAKFWTETDRLTVARNEGATLHQQGGSE